MNRCILLTVMVVSAFAATGLRAGCRVAKAEGYLEVRVSVKDKKVQFSVDEFGADGKSLGTIRCDDDRGLTLFMKRTAKDPTAPKELRLVVEDGSNLEGVFAAVGAIGAAEFKQLKYYGCVPPGCSIPAGAQHSMPRHDGKIFSVEELDKIVSYNGTKC